MADREFVVDASEVGTNLDKFVAHRAGVSRRIARQWIRLGRVDVGGKTLKVMGKPLRSGQKVTVRPESAPNPGSGTAMPVIVYVDASLVVIDKPPKLLSEGAPSLETEVPKLLDHAPVFLAHRLDAGTSGLIVLARKRSALRHLNQQFREGSVTKRYLALLQGRYEREETVNAPVGRVKGTRHGVRDGGRPARTDFRSLRAQGNASLVEATLHTGRTHQIRVHATHLGHPLLGDGLYGGARYTLEAEPQAIARPMLHALELGFSLPGGVWKSFHVAPPDDFKRCAASFALEHAILD